MNEDKMKIGAPSTHSKQLELEGISNHFIVCRISTISSRIHLGAPDGDTYCCTGSPLMISLPIIKMQKNCIICMRKLSHSSLSFPCFASVHLDQTNTEACKRGGMVANSNNRSGPEGDGRVIYDDSDKGGLVADPGNLTLKELVQKGHVGSPWKRGRTSPGMAKEGNPSAPDPNKKKRKNHEGRTEVKYGRSTLRNLPNSRLKMTTPMRVSRTSSSIVRCAVLPSKVRGPAPPTRCRH